MTRRLALVLALSCLREQLPRRSPICRLAPAPLSGTSTSMSRRRYLRAGQLQRLLRMRRTVLVGVSAVGQERGDGAGVHQAHCRVLRTMTMRCVFCIGLWVASATPVLAQEESRFDGIVGAGILVVGDSPWVTGELGLNAWLSPGFGIGAQHSLQSDGTERAQLTSVKLNFRRRLNDRAHMLFSWSPFLSSITEDDGHEFGIGVYPMLDVFLRMRLSDREGFSVQGGFNILAMRGGWFHPMLLGVFSF